VRFRFHSIFICEALYFPENMSLARRGVGRLFGPFHELARAGLRDFDSEFDRVIRRVAPNIGGFAMQGFTPAVNVKESDKELLVTAELPGMNKDDIKLEVNDSVLTLRGERSEEKSEEHDRWHVMERSHGSFSRSFQLPENVNTDEIQASYKDGVLQLTIPKVVEQKPEPKKITIGDS
jgi:HSP20 family protein